MTRGLKVSNSASTACRDGCVTLIDPMTRGLKDTITLQGTLNRAGKLHWLTRWQGDWKPRQQGSNRAEEEKLHWLTRWQGDWKKIEPSSLMIACLLVTLIDPMTRGLKASGSCPCASARIAALHWLTRWQGDWKKTFNCSFILSILLLHWLTRWQGDWKGLTARLFFLCFYTLHWLTRWQGDWKPLILYYDFIICF